MRKKLGNICNHAEVVTARWRHHNRTSRIMKKQPLDYFRNDHWLVRLVVLLIHRLTLPTIFAAAISILKPIVIKALS
jgi:hypothetical protein